MILNELKSGKVEFIKLTKSHRLAKKHQINYTNNQIKSVS